MVPDKDPLTGAEDEDFVAKVLARLKESREHSAQWREDAREDYAFQAGDQWSQEDAQMLREQLRPVITFNRIQPILDSVAGMEVGNRREVKFIPRTEGDEQANEVLTAGTAWMRDQCDAEDEESDMFIDAIVCGMGWTETSLSYDRDQDGEVTINRTDPLEMYWDSAAKKRNLADARFLFRVRDVPKEEFEALFPGASDLSPETQIEGEDRDITLRIVDPHDQYADSKNEIRAARKGERRVVEYQWIDKTPIYRLEDTDGQIKVFTKEKFETLASRAREMETPLPKHVRQTTQKVMRAFICGGKLLEKGDAPCKDHFNYRCVTGKRDRNRNTWYGLVKGMKDPQRWANKWLSQVLHIINSNAKGGIIAEQDAFANTRQAEATWADPSAITWVRPGAIANNKIRDKPMINYPTGLDRLMEFAISSIRDDTGVNVEMLGAREAGQAASLEHMRKQSAFTILATLFDGLRRYRKEQGRVLLYFVVNYLSDGRLVRIVGEQGAQFVKLVRDPSVIKYDVIVDDAPTSPNQKEYVWSALAQIVPVLMKTGAPAQLWAELVKFSPLPSSVAAKIGRIITQPQGPSPEAQAEQMRQQAEQQKQQHDMALKDREAEHEMMMKDREAQQTGTEHQANIEFKEVEHRLDLESKAIDREMKLIDLDMKKIEADTKTAELVSQETQARIAAKPKEDEAQASKAALSDILAAAAKLDEAAQILAAVATAPKEVLVHRGRDGLIKGATATTRMN